MRGLYIAFVTAVLALSLLVSGAFAQATRTNLLGVSTTPDNQILVELAPEDSSAANLFDLNGRTVVFRPDGLGRYTREVRSLEWEDALGSEVTQEWEKFRDGIQVSLGEFEFKYAGQRYDSFFVSKHGLITFGGPLEYLHIKKSQAQPISVAAAWFGTTATISPLYKPKFGGLWINDPLAAQYVARWPDRVVVTWLASDDAVFYPGGVPPEQPERYQAVLRSDGSIQFNFGHITVRDGIVGLFSNEPLRKGEVIGTIADALDRVLPGDLDLLSVTLYETDGDAVILEFTTREPVREPETGFYNYRLFFDMDRPYTQDWSDIDLVWKIEVGGQNDNWGGEFRAGDGPNKIELVAEIRDLQGDSAWVWGGADHYDDSRSFVRGKGTEPLFVTLPVVTTADLSEPESRFSRISMQNEVFHYRSAPDLGEIACRIIGVLGEQFDLFTFHSEVRTDEQSISSNWIPYENGVSGLGIPPRHTPCGEGRLLGHYFNLIWMPARSHAWRAGDFRGALNLLAHEFIHSWTAHLSYARSDGARGRLTGDSCNCHWRPELHTPTAFPLHGEEAQSIMAGGLGRFWRDNGDGTFTAVENLRASGPSWLDLYAMGLANASEVPNVFILRNLQPVYGNDQAGWSGQYWGTYHADKEVVSIDQVIAAEGPRVPSAAGARRDFNAGFVYMLEPSQTPDPEMLRLHREYRDKVIEHWSDITGGRSRITATLAGVANRSPVSTGTLADQVVLVAENVVVGLRRAFRDPDGDPLTYEATSSTPTVTSVATSGGTVTVRGEAPGTATVTVTATDSRGSNAAATLAFRVTVRERGN